MINKNKARLLAMSALAVCIHSALAQDVSSGAYVGTTGSDEFVVIGKTLPEGTSINGLVGNKDNLGRVASGVYDPAKTYTLTQTLTLATDATVNLGFQATGPGTFSTSAISTASTTRGTPNFIDTIVFNKSGDFTNLLFTNIEEIHLANGVKAKISGEAFDSDATSLDLGLINPGLHFFGTPGGKAEQPTIVAHITVPAGNDEVFAGEGNNYLVGGPGVAFIKGEKEMTSSPPMDLLASLVIVRGSPPPVKSNGLTAIESIRS